MKNKLLLLIILFSISSAAIATNINAPKKTETVLMDCSGNFDIDGKSYTITLHDVSTWTCIKFKVGSWFN